MPADGGAERTRVGTTGAKSLGSGSITIDGLRQRFVVMRNDRKRVGSQEPDYVVALRLSTITESWDWRPERAA